MGSTGWVVGQVGVEGRCRRVPSAKVATAATASVVKVFMMAAMQAKLNFARERDSSNRLAEHL